MNDINNRIALSSINDKVRKSKLFYLLVVNKLYVIQERSQIKHCFVERNASFQENLT